MTSENTAPVSARGESAWLIERGGQWYAAAPHSRWTTQQAIDANTWRENWTTDANKALRFARKCDAETLIRYESLQNAVATEHVWLEREPDLRDPRNIRRALRQAQDNLERAAASPAPGDDFTPDGNCRAVEAARQIAALQGSEGGHAGKLEGAPTGGAAHLLGGERRFEHELKTWPRYFDALVDATKTFEVRQNDRAFEVGDTLWLREYRPGFGEGVYTGRELRRRVTYILHGGEFGIAAGHVVMGLATLPEPPVPRQAGARGA